MKIVRLPVNRTGAIVLLEFLSRPKGNPGPTSRLIPEFLEK
jgi:hypothetical protein